METDFEELPFAAISVLKKVYSRGFQEHAMSKSPHKRSRKLEVQSMFEPNRLEQHSLHQAYSYLVPVLNRRLLTNAATMERLSQVPAGAGERIVP
jgi:hypothetical protein